MNGCLTERTLTFLRADEGGAEERAHLRACRACAARYRELERDLDAIANVLRAGPPGDQARAHGLRWRAVGAIAAALVMTVATARLWRGVRAEGTGDVGVVSEELADALFTAPEAVSPGDEPVIDVADESVALDEDDDLALLFEGP